MNDPNSIPAVEARAVEIISSVTDWPHGAASIYMRAIHDGLLRSKHASSPTILALRAGISEAMLLLAHVAEEEERKRNSY